MSDPVWFRSDLRLTVGRTSDRNQTGTRHRLSLGIITYEQCSRRRMRLVSRTAKPAAAGAVRRGGEAAAPAARGKVMCRSGASGIDAAHADQERSVSVLEDERPGGTAPHSA